MRKVWAVEVFDSRSGRGLGLVHSKEGEVRLYESEEQALTQIGMFFGTTQVDEGGCRIYITEPERGVGMSLREPRPSRQRVLLRPTPFYSAK